MGGKYRINFLRFVLAGYILGSLVFIDMAFSQSSKLLKYSKSVSNSHKTSALQIYYRSAIGHLGGAFGLFGAYALLEDAFGGKTVFASINCCAYFPALIGGPIGSSLVLMGKPNSPVHSVKQALILLAISGSETVLYHVLFGNRRFRKNNNIRNRQQAILGSLILGVTIIPLSHALYLRTNVRSQSIESSGTLLEDPKSLGLFTYNRKGLRAGFPGLWIKTIPEASIHRFTPDKPHVYYFLSLFSFTF